MRKTIHYRKIEWFNTQGNEDTVALLRHSLQARPYIENTVFQVSGETCELRHRDERGNSICLHFSTHVVGARREVSPMAQGVPNSDLADASAPAQSEFTEREVAVVVQDGRLGYVSMGIVQSSFVERCLRGLLSLDHGTDLTNRLMLAARADVQMVQQLLQEGVHSLDMGLSLSQVEADEQIHGQPQSLQSALAQTVKDALSARFQNELDDAQLERLAANAHLVLNFVRTLRLIRLTLLLR